MSTKCTREAVVVSKNHPCRLKKNTGTDCFSSHPLPSHAVFVKDVDLFHG